MASLNPLTREVVFKIVFYGPGLGGKTTTLQYIHAASKPEHRGKMVSLATPMDRTLYFDFLPLRMPLVHGMHVRLQLFTVPGQVYFGATRKLVLTGADGVVFVADSQVGRQDANQEALEDLVMNLAENNLALLNMPHTFHWNKRDIPEVVSIAELDRTLNRQGAPSLGTVATTGEGVFAGLERIAKLVFQAYEAELPKAEMPATGPLERTPVIEDTTIADALRGLAEAPMRPRLTPTEGFGAVKPNRPRATPTESLGAVKGGPSSSRGGAAPVSSLESIPNPIPRRPTGSFDTTGAASAPASSTASHTPARTPAPKGPPSRAGMEAVRTPTAPRVKPPMAAPSSPTLVQAVAQEDLVAMTLANPGAASSSNGGPPSSHVLSSRDGAGVHDGSQQHGPRRRETREMVATSPPPKEGQAVSFVLLWQEADRDAARQVEAALGAGDPAAALLMCDVLVTRLLAAAAGLTGNAEAPRDPGLVVLLLGLDGRRYLAFRASIRGARAHDPVSTADALEAYVFALEVRRALAAIGW